jgi:hypothetical protein
MVARVLHSEGKLIQSFKNVHCRIAVNTNGRIPNPMSKLQCTTGVALRGRIVRVSRPEYDQVDSVRRRLLALGIKYHTGAAYPPLYCWLENDSIADEGQTGARIDLHPLEIMRQKARR